MSKFYHLSAAQVVKHPLDEGVLDLSQASNENQDGSAGCDMWIFFNKVQMKIGEGAGHV